MSGSKGLKYMQMRDDTHGDIDENIISTQNLESSSFYEFRKILSSDQYSIGKKVAEFFVDFAGNYKSIKESAELLPQPMESVYLLVNEITETFFADFNYGKSETKQMMPYCKISVEKYIFDKVMIERDWSVNNNKLGLYTIICYVFGKIRKTIKEIHR